jgi:hypothetical protein
MTKLIRSCATYANSPKKIGKIPNYNVTLWSVSVNIVDMEEMSALFLVIHSIKIVIIEGPQ